MRSLPELKKGRSLGALKAPPVRTTRDFLKRVQAALTKHRAAIIRIGGRVQLDIAGDGAWVIDFNKAQIFKGHGKCHATLKARARYFHAMLNGRACSGLELLGDPKVAAVLFRLMALEASARR